MWQGGYRGRRLQSRHGKCCPFQGWKKGRRPVFSFLHSLIKPCAAISGGILSLQATSDGWRYRVFDLVSLRRLRRVDNIRSLESERWYNLDGFLLAHPAVIVRNTLFVSRPWLPHHRPVRPLQPADAAIRPDHMLSNLPVYRRGRVCPRGTTIETRTPVPGSLPQPRAAGARAPWFLRER